MEFDLEFDLDNANHDALSESKRDALSESKRDALSEPNTTQKATSSTPKTVPSPNNNDTETRITVSETSDNTGLYLLLASQFFNSVMVISTKLLETDPAFEDDPIEPFQILVVRMLITFIGTLLYMYFNKHKIPHVPFGPPEVRKWLIARGSFGFFGVFGLYTSLKALSISDAIVITFLTPTLTGILAACILKERYSRIEGICGLIALFGVVLVVRPTFLFHQDATSNSDKNEEAVESSSSKARVVASLFGLLGVCGASSIYIIIKHIGTRAHAIMSVTYFAFISFLISLCGIIFSPNTTFKIPQTLNQWFLFFIIGISGFIMQLLLTLGIQKERKTSRSSLVIYSQMIYSLFWDLLIFHHLPNFWSWLGIIIIVSSTLYALFYKNMQTNKSTNQQDVLNYAPQSNGTEMSTDFELEDYEDSSRDMERL